MNLTRTEFEILAALAREPGVVIDRPALLASVWGPGYTDDHLVDVHVANLRRKLGDDPEQPRFVETVAASATGWRRPDAPPAPLRSRLVVSHLVVALAALGTVLVAISLVGPGYFADAMGHRPGDPEGQAMDAATLAAFQDAVRTALLAAFASALIAAVIVALALSSRIATPVTRLGRRGSTGCGRPLRERVPESGEGEIGELAETFNAMAGSLEATERRRLQLVGDVAHELRTPLATLDGYLEGLQDGVVDPAPETWTLLRRETGPAEPPRRRPLATVARRGAAAATHDRGARCPTLAADVVEQFRSNAAARSLQITSTRPTA